MKIGGIVIIIAGITLFFWHLMSDGLPFHRLTFDDKNGKDTIGLLVGNGTANHHTHNITEPITVAFEAGGREPGGMLDIEDPSGTKTLITFIQPLPARVEHALPT